MSAIADVIAGAVGGIGSIATSIYNMSSDQRNYDYQKALQQQIFQREDTAVQRRMADLEAAGLNPQLAAGSGAGAGSIVSTKAPQWQGNALGNALDMASHIEQLRQQKKQTQMQQEQINLLKVQQKNAQQDFWSKVYANEFDKALKDYWLGDKNTEYIYNSGNFNLSRYFDMLNYQLENQKNSADMLQKQNDMYTTQQIMNMVSQGIGSVTDLTGGFKNITGGIQYLSGNLNKRRY